MDANLERYANILHLMTLIESEARNAREAAAAGQEAAVAAHHKQVVTPGAVQANGARVVKDPQAEAAQAAQFAFKAQRNSIENVLKLSRRLAGAVGTSL